MVINFPFIYMTLYTTVNYTDLYPGNKPTIEELLEGIPSNLLIMILSVINSEITAAKDFKEVQTRMTSFIAQRFSQSELLNIDRRLSIFKEKTQGTSIIWGKRYVLEFIKYEFLNYRDLEHIELTPEHEMKIFQAYLLIVERLNDIDRLEFKKNLDLIEKNDEYQFEKIVWPFVLKQYDNNNTVNPISQFIKLFALIKHSLTDPEILKSWKLFLKYNGFEKLNNYLAGVHFLVNVTQNRQENGSFLRAFTRIKQKDLPSHFLNLCLDFKEFSTKEDNKVDFKGIREKPLFNYKDENIIVLDMNFLNNKIYNGPLFDMYYKTDMATNTRFKDFPQFKTHIGTHVSENIIFKGIMKKLFKKNFIKLYFDDDSKSNCPDAYIRYGSKVFLVEFKDYLFPGSLVDKYSFDDIKAHIDLKFINNNKKKNKGISQIVEQIKILSTTKFEFDKFSDKTITVYPVIVHTNFAYQLPGVNDYLRREFEKRVGRELLGSKTIIEKLVLIDLDSFFDFLLLENFSIKTLEGFLKKYCHIIENRVKKFQQHVNQQNFVRSRESFDEIYKSIIKPELKILSVEKSIDILLETIEVDEGLFEGF